MERAKDAASATAAAATEKAGEMLQARAPGAAHWTAQRSTCCCMMLVGLTDENPKGAPLPCSGLQQLPGRALPLD